MGVMESMFKIMDAWPRHRLHLDLPGDVDVVVAHGSDGLHDLAALMYGVIDSHPLVRVHSRCLYGEVFGSRDCDCRNQLLASMKLMREAGGGIFIYLDQEGRGAGLYGKAQGYELSQQRGIDSFAAYEQLQMNPDSRRYGDAAELLKRLGIHRVRLITNNPAKIEAMENAGLIVERVRLDLVELGFPIPEEAREYLESKQRHGHLP